jgi:DNA polymerase III subunit epsilon
MLKNIRLEKPLAFIDLETTGNRYYADRVVEFSVLKMYPEGGEEFRSRLVNPEMQISPEATEKHGLTNSDLEKEPTFRQLAKGICDLMEGCDLSGFNILGFDLPLLEREFDRVGVSFSRDGRRVVDSMAIFHMRVPRDPANPRNLAAAFLKYCGKELLNAHTAESDVRASAEILDGQLESCIDLPRDVDNLCLVCLEHRKAFIDIGGRLIWLENREAGFNFGKHKGLSIREVAFKYPDYLGWMLRQDFSPEVLEIVIGALNGEFLKKP